MPSRLSPNELDEILALQLTVAWAGESAGDPPRLGWWPSDLVDPEGGGDLFARLAPHTAAWASLVLVREAARRVDESLRRPIDTDERFVTLFHFGFAIDEQLDDRLAFHRQQRHVPREVLGEHFLVGAKDARPALETLLATLGNARVEITPGGRKLSPRSNATPALARELAAALLPLGEKYPLPYVDAPS